MPLRKRKEVQTVLRKKADCLRSGRSVLAFTDKYLFMKEVIKVVLVEELKSRLGAYEEPLKDLRDSL